MRKKVAVWGLAMGMALMLGAASCSAGDAVTAAQKISAYLPAVTALANDAALVAEAFDAADAALIQQVSTQVQTELTELSKVCAAYVAAPTSDNWAKLGTAMDELVNDADASLLAASGIKNAKSQAKAKLALSALDAAVHVLDGYLASARTTGQTQAALAARRVKLAEVTAEWNSADWQRANAQTNGCARELAVMAEAGGY
ncbi:MAG: hypothetical protein P4M01_14450 [Acidobacteriota bacterium]|nr:hypothetical protein [Acidobacteriota bacterium]